MNALLLTLLVMPVDGDAWWSLQPVARPAVPLADNVPAEFTHWPHTPIDAFILQKLSDHGLTPAPEADRRTLIRRLTYNLHGLPPTPHEIHEFVHDPAADAYERLVDRLLASPRYGERWGRHWLDIVHYGETHGYDKDKPRPNAWPYRDYVIRALNQDKSYSRFVQEQLAGDRLFPDHPDGIVATGFISAGPWDFVGHVELPESKTDGLIARYNDRDDMLSAAMSTFQSLTVHCARCHDHKFDPIPARDYYRLQAVFAGVDRADRMYDPDPATHQTRRRLATEREQLAARHKELTDRVSKLRDLELIQLDERIAVLRRQVEMLAKPPGQSSPTNGYHSAIMPSPDATKWVQIDLGRDMPVDEVRLLPARPTDFPDTPGFGFPLRFRVDAARSETPDAWHSLADRSARDEPSPGDTPFVVNTRSKAPASQTEPLRVRFVRVTATRLWERTNDFVFALAELQVVSDGKNVAHGATVTAADSIEAGRWSTKYLVDDYSSRKWLGSAGAEAAERAAAIGTARAELEGATAARANRIAQLLEPDPRAEFQRLTVRLDQIDSELKDLPPQQPVYAAASRFTPQGSFVPPPAPRVIHLLNRGDVKQPGPAVAPGGLSCVAALEPAFELDNPNDEASRRAALAQWITDPQNPLTRRSIVNRVWQYHFGRGIVDTPNDFGRMGSEPTHPELLDWLASWFLDNGESIKSLHRLILTSAAYRQSSRGHDEFARIDGEDRYLWRMHRTRLDAECVRDAALAVAGRLDPAMGGPSVRQFVFKDDHSPVYDYFRFDINDPDNYRRSVYRFIVRSVPDPFMDCLDFADPSLLVPKRTATLTALQALAMWNNRIMLRAAELLADRVRGTHTEPTGQVERAFELALGRPPRDDELELLRQYTDTHGLENTCRLIVNSNEFLFVD